MDFARVPMFREQRFVPMDAFSPMEWSFPVLKNLTTAMDVPYMQEYCGCGIMESSR